MIQIETFTCTPLKPSADCVPVTWAYDLETEKAGLVAECKRLNSLGDVPVVYYYDTRGNEEAMEVQTMECDYGGKPCLTKHPSMYAEIWKRI